jgi:hypothetical protein
MTLSDAARDLRSPQLALDAAGNATVVWVSDIDNEDRVQVATRPAGGAWTIAGDVLVAARRGLVGGGEKVIDFDAAADAAGNVTAVWTSEGSVGLTAHFASRPAGGVWTRVGSLGESGEQVTAPHLAVNAAGDTVVVYQGLENVTRSSVRPAGGDWTPPQTLSAPGEQTSSADVGLGANGDAVAVWSTREFWGIRAATRPADETWTAPQNVSAPGVAARDLRVAVNDDGQAVAVWLRYDGAAWVTEASVLPANGAWTAAEVLSGAGRQTEFPGVAMDREGNAIAVWRHSDQTGDVVEAAVRPTGQRWTDRHEMSPGHPPNVSAPEIAMNASGGALAVWAQHTGTDVVVAAAAYDRHGPRLESLRIPASGVAGTSLDTVVEPLDLWSAIAWTTWDFGDGGTASGTTVSHTYAAAGDYTITAAAGDLLGNASSASRVVRIVPRLIEPPVTIEPPPPPPSVLPPPVLPPPRGDRVARERVSFVNATLKRTMRLPRAYRSQRSKVCHGEIQATLTLKRKRLDFKTVRLDRRCRYRVSFRIRRSRLGDTKRVTIGVRFLGNAYLGANVKPSRYSVKVKSGGTT